MLLTGLPDIMINQKLYNIIMGLFGVLDPAGTLYALNIQLNYYHRLYDYEHITNNENLF